MIAALVVFGWLSLALVVSILVGSWLRRGEVIEHMTCPLCRGEGQVRARRSR